MVGMGVDGYEFGGRLVGKARGRVLSLDGRLDGWCGLVVLGRVARLDEGEVTGSTALSRRSELQPSSAGADASTSFGAGGFAVRPLGDVRDGRLGQRRRVLNLQR